MSVSAVPWRPSSKSSEHRRGLVWGPLSALVFLACLVLAVGEPSTFDRELGMLLFIEQPAWLVGGIRVITSLGDTIPIVALCAIVLAWTVSRGAARLGLLMAGWTLLTHAGNLLLKAGLGRERPTFIEAALLPSTHSFPSGHAMVSTVAYGMVALVVARLEPRYARPAAWAAGLLAFFIGLSRILLGVHWPSDVLAGFIAGSWMLGFGKRAMDRLASSPGPAPIGSED